MLFDFFESDRILETRLQQRASTPMKATSASIRLLRTLVLAVVPLGWLPSAMALGVGDIPPDYVGRNFDDEAVYISQHRGKVVVVTFWATWCAPCRAELDMLERVQQVAGKAELQVIAVNYRQDDDVWRTLQKALRPLQISFTRDPSQEVAEIYEVTAIPRMFIVDRDGELAYEHRGYGEASLDGILLEINLLLNQPAKAGEPEHS